MDGLEAVTRELLAECNEDHVGLWEVVRSVQASWPGSDDRQVRDAVLRLLKDLLEQRLIVAGVPTADGQRFETWNLSPAEIIASVERQWNALNRAPSIDEIVWFTAARER